MKPGITQLCLKRQDLEADLRQARECGFEAIELAFSDAAVPALDGSREDLLGIRRSCDRLGLAIPSIIATRKDAGSLLSPNPAERAKRVAILRRGLEVAEALGVDGMLLHPGQMEAADSYERAWKDCRDALKGLADEAAKRRCAIAVENVWNKFLLSPREARQFVDDVGSEWIGIYLDTGNLIHYGFTEMWIQELQGRIKKVHVKDYKRQARQFVQLMEGDCNWPAIIQGLRGMGFDGALVSEVGGEAKEQAETAARIRKLMAL